MDEFVPRTAAILPQRGIGDLLWHLPYLRVLAEKHCRSRLTVILKPSTQAHQLLREERCIEEVVYTQQHFTGGFSYLRKVHDYHRLFRKHRIGRIFILDKVSSPAIAGALAGVRRRYGYGTTRTQRRWLTQKEHLDESLHRAFPLVKAQAYFRMLGTPVMDTEPRLLLTKGERQQAATLIHDLPRPLFAVGPGASSKDRIWPPERTAAVCRWFLEEHGGGVILIGGKGEEALAERVILASEPYEKRVRNLVGKLDLRLSAAVIQHADLFFGMDSGPFNMAAAVETHAFGIAAATPRLDYSRFIHSIPADDGSFMNRGGIALTSTGHVISILEDFLRDREQSLSAPG